MLKNMRYCLAQSRVSLGLRGVFVVVSDLGSVGTAEMEICEIEHCTNMLLMCRGILTHGGKISAILLLIIGHHWEYGVFAFSPFEFCFLANDIFYGTAFS